MNKSSPSRAEGLPLFLIRGSCLDKMCRDPYGFCRAALCLGLTGLFLLRSAWLTEAFSAVLSALCLFTPFEDFVNNSFSIPAVVYYLTVTAVFLFLTAQDIEKRRWN